MAVAHFTVARVIPADAVRSFGELKVGLTSGREIDEVDFPFFSETVFRVTIIIVSDQLVAVGHFGKRERLGGEEREGVTAVIPTEVSRAPVFAKEIILGEFVAKIVFYSHASGHQGSPEGVFAAFVNGLKFSFCRHAWIAWVGRHAKLSISRFVESNDPRAAAFLRFVEPFENLLVAVGEGVVLQGGSGEGFFAQECVVDFVLLFGVAVNDDVMVVRVHTANVVGHGELLLGALRVFFSDVPIEGEVVSEASDEFATVELALDAEFTTIKCG